MKPITITILRGSPTFEDGTDETTLTIYKDELQMIEYYIEFVVVDGWEEYIILRDGVPLRWAMTDNRGVTYESR